MSTVEERVPQAGFWQSVSSALRGADQDYTQIAIPRAIFLLAIPMVLEMVMESLFAIVDVFWVAHLGANAVATVGLTESMLTLVFAVAMGLSMSATAMVARRIGEKDARGAAVAAAQAILLGVAVAAVVGIPGYTLAPRLLEWMGAPADLVATGREYTSLVLGGSVAVMLLFLNNAIFRGAGDPAIAMRVLWFANILNIILGPFFIFGWGPFPQLGVTGAAVATLIGRSSGVMYQLFVLFTGRSRVHLTPAALGVNWHVLWSLVRVSGMGVMQFVIAHTSWILLVRIVSSFGSAAVAGYTIGIRIFIFSILPSWGLSGATSTLVGQNLGAKRPDRAERAVTLTGIYNMVFLAVVALASIAFAEPVVRFFTTDPSVVPSAVACLRIISMGNLAYAWGMVFVQAFNGAGDTTTPTLLNIVGFWLCEIPLAWTLAIPAGWGPAGVFAAVPMAESMLTVLSWLVFRRGGWKLREI